LVSPFKINHSTIQHITQKRISQEKNEKKNGDVSEAENITKNGGTMDFI
jgi:hypothetical protein